MPVFLFVLKFAIKIQLLCSDKTLCSTFLFLVGRLEAQSGIIEPTNPAGVVVYIFSSLCLSINWLLVSMSVGKDNLFESMGARVWGINTVFPIT